MFDDADIGQAIAGLMVSKFCNAGQTCVCSNRVFVHDTIYDDFLAALIEKVKGLTVGFGVEEGVTIGPLIHERAADNVIGLIDEAIAQGAKLVLGGCRSERGFYAASPKFLQSLRKLCDEHGILLIVDEIQSGFGRTGKFFACEYADIEPDLITTAKGMAGGFPLAAVVGKAEIMDAPLLGGLGGTYGGSPVGCAAALAVINTIEKYNLVSAANRIASLFDRHLTHVQKKYPQLIGDIRADRGAMIAIELIKDGDSSRPNPELTKLIVSEAYRRGLVVLSCGVRGNVFRFLPALTISDELINEGLDIFEQCFDACVN